MIKQELTLRKKELETELETIRNKLYNFNFEEKKAKYGNKFTCGFCKFNAVQDFSGDGWHNICGADNCTCCHSVCEKYEPDNEITLFIKKNIRTDSGFLRSDRTNGYGHIDEDEYEAIEELVGDIFMHTNLTDKFKAVLTACFDLKGGEQE